MKPTQPVKLPTVIGHATIEANGIQHTALVTIFEETLPLFEAECPCGFAHSTLQRLIGRERRTLAECQAANLPVAEHMAAGVEQRISNITRHLNGLCKKGRTNVTRIYYR